MLIWKKQRISGEIRFGRIEPYFQSLDVDYLKATEAQNVTLKSHIETKKQQLRDAPEDSRIDEADTPELLKSVDPYLKLWTSQN